MEKEISIIVAGKSCTGKSAVVQTIAAVLADLGLDSVEVKSSEVKRIG